VCWGGGGRSPYIVILILEVNADKTEYMFMSHHQTTGQNCVINVADFKYLGMVVTNRNWIHEEIKRRFNQGMLATMQFRIFCFPVVKKHET
jgi:hypothetical protein